MTRDHFQDIIPPSDPQRQPEPETVAHEHNDAVHSESITMASSDKSIRNINIVRRATPADPGRASAGPRTSSHGWLWIIAGISVLALGTFGLLYAFRKTTVTVVAHRQPVTFDQTMQFTAYPVGASAATGTIAYTTQTADLQDSSTVQASSTTHREDKASGNITVFNAYSETPVKLIKDTRFQTPTGLVFKTPAAIEVPGKQGNTPGKVTVTVVASAAGAQYNIAPNVKLTLPGLQSNAPMFSGVYAQTAASTTGGFIGDAPSVPDDALQAQRSALHTQLQQKARDYAASVAKDGIALDPVVTFTDDQPQTGTGSNVAIGSTAHVVVPVVAESGLASAIAKAVTADATGIPFTLLPGKDFATKIDDTSVQIGSDPITFNLSGSATLVATIDPQAIAQALAGRSVDTFKPILENIPGVDSGNADVEPRWETKFPQNPNDITVEIK